ncbi:MAG: hypothetical protein O9353_08700 [Bacteroidia bacterium]|nr:hypothetical protein [Polaromonas sp.]MCZ8285526.1 hypothetical protein [Bacteroidia bacterium]
MNTQSNRVANQEADSDNTQAEAAQYALLRRLAPVIRHNMAGSLQPIAMVAGMLERRLQKNGTDPEILLKNARDIVALSKEAAASCMSLMGWFAPKEDPLVATSKGVAECLDMIATELSFRSFSITNNTSQAEGEISLTALRNVFTAAVIALTDVTATPHEIVVEAELSEGAVSIRVSLKKTNATATLPGSKPYRRIEWRDVEALAGSLVRLSHTEDEVEMAFPSATQNTRQDVSLAGQA